MAKQKFYDENGNEVNVKINKPFYRKWWVWILIALVVFYFIGSLTEDDREQINEKTEAKTTQEKETDLYEKNMEEISKDAAEESNPVIAEVGQTITYSDETGDLINVTLDSANYDSGDDFYEASNGQYVKADFTIENVSSSAFTANAADYSIYDADGSKGEVISKGFMLEEVMPGKKYSGTVYFDVTNNGPFEVYLYDSAWSVNP